MMESYSGLKEYVPEICSIAERVEDHFHCKGGCSQYKRKEQYICPCLGRDGSGWIPVSNERVQAWISDVNRWNDCRSRIPNEDNYSLEGINHFRIFKFTLCINQFGHDNTEEVKTEIPRLLANGDKIWVMEDYGAGEILIDKEGVFTVEKSYYGELTKPVENGTIDDVIKFLFGFWGSPEPYSYTKAGYPELERQGSERTRTQKEKANE